MPGEGEGNPRWAPEQGDLIWIALDPAVGHEQAGRRPALVISPALYNGRAGRALCCPVTSRVRGYPFEVVLPAGLPLAGVILADQIRSLDWRARDARLAGAAPPAVVAEVKSKLGALIFSASASTGPGARRKPRP